MIQQNGQNGSQITATVPEPAPRETIIGSPRGRARTGAGTGTEQSNA